MLRRDYTDKVRRYLAVTREEAAELIAGLPESISARLEAVLDLEDVVLRYDQNEHRAYFVARQEPGLVVWTWDDIRDFEMAGHLLAPIAGMDGPLSEDVALGLYRRATAHEYMF
jgi:hypothetical protein